MRDKIKKYLESYRAGLIETLNTLNLDEVADLVEALEDAREQGKTIFIAGNGGSSATASHMANDLVKTAYRGEGPHFRAICLNDNTPLITAIGNDISYDEIFAYQLDALGQRGDLLIVITGSGNSANILKAVEVAAKKGIKTFGILGFDGGKVKDMLDGHVIVRSNHYGLVEDIHMVLDHMIAFLFKGG